MYSSSLLKLLRHRDIFESTSAGASKSKLFISQPLVCHTEIRKVRLFRLLDRGEMLEVKQWINDQCCRVIGCALMQYIFKTR